MTVSIIYIKEDKLKEVIDKINAAIHARVIIDINDNLPDFMMVVDKDGVVTNDNISLEGITAFYRDSFGYFASYIENGINDVDLNIATVEEITSYIDAAEQQDLQSVDPDCI